jgi:type II secretory pathway component GspD/PulD (secretin)
MVRFVPRSSLALLLGALACAPSAPCAEDGTAPALPSDDSASAQATEERPRIRYWLRDPASPAEAKPDAVPAVAAPATPAAERTGRSPDDRRAAMRDLFDQMMKKARRAYGDKDYARCISLCRNILTADPRHTDAAELLSKAREQETSADRDVTFRASTRKSQDAVLEAEEHAIRPPVRVPETRPAWPRRSDDPTLPKRERMAKVLEEPVTVDFVSADLEWVLNTLFIITGVNIIADPAALEGKALTLHVEKIPLRAVLDFIVRNNDGIQYSVTDDAVWITATTATDLKKIMVPKVYPIHHGLVSSRTAQGMSAGQRAGNTGRANTGAGGRSGGRQGAAGAQQPGQQGQQQQELSYLEMVLDWLQAQADPQTFPDGSQYWIDKPSNQLVIYTTPAGHDKLREFLDAFDQPPIQVLIKARFLTITDRDEKGLGTSLDNISGDVRWGSPNNLIPWSFANNTALTGASTLIPTTAAGIFSINGSRLDPKFQITINALLASSNTRILSEPQILTINNKEAFIDITTNFSYITDLREVTGTQFGGNGVAATNVVAYVPQFDTENIGFTLFVTPSVGRDLKTINLHLRPIVDELAEGQQISQFQTFEVIGANQTNANQTTTPPVIRRPTIDQRSLETDVVLEDNGFVIIGGLIRNRIETVEKKIPGLHRIPGLGYLFKSKSDVRERNNLMIIIEAQIITPRGRTYRTDPNPDDGDIREGGSNRAPGQVSEVRPREAPKMGVPRAEPLPVVTAPIVPAQGAWRVSEEERGQ